MLSALGIVVYLWHKELLLAAAVFVHLSFSGSLQTGAGGQIEE